MFITSGAISFTKRSTVSIHPMLMFISMIFCHSFKVKSFNTSYVNVYLQKAHNIRLHYIVSIHPMLMFIKVLQDALLTVLSVSIHPMLMFIVLRLSEKMRKKHSFNTSYVNVYRTVIHCLRNSKHLFQYILC